MDISTREKDKEFGDGEFGQLENDKFNLPNKFKLEIRGMQNEAKEKATYQKKKGGCPSFEWGMYAIGTTSPT